MPWNIIASIDGNDKTIDIVKDYNKKYNFIKGLKNNGRNGKGNAIKNSLKYVSSDYVFLMDADNSMLLSDIINSLNNLKNNYDTIIFNRYIKKIKFHL
ncbi:glycosyltransferase [Oxyplasma meridianum]|uniref:Glycosyltransferase n=1 Tax=Oxyplasma meridianum TaxID=3073602 RepID=A0AAX4NG86_9ARCH